MTTRPFGPCDSDACRAERTAREDELAALRARSIALERIHSCITRDEVLLGIQDVVINLLGSEELVVYEPRGDALVPVRSFGVDGERLDPVPLGADHAVSRAAAQRRAWIAGDAAAPDDPDLTACLPLLAGGRLAGVLAIWKILPHKGALRPADRELAELLVTHAGVALYLTEPGRGGALA